MPRGIKDERFYDPKQIRKSIAPQGDEIIKAIENLNLNDPAQYRKLKTFNSEGHV